MKTCTRTYLDVLAGDSANAPGDGLDVVTLRVLQLQVLVNDLKHSAVVDGHTLLKKLERKTGRGEKEAASPRIHYHQIYYAPTCIYLYYTRLYNFMH